MYRRRKRLNMNLNEQDPQSPLPEVYPVYEAQKCFSHPKERAVLEQPINENYRFIPLTKGQVAIVDLKHYERFSKYCWQAHWSKDTQTFYAQRRGPNSEGKMVCISMHREVMGVSDRHTLVDHRERSKTLDNREANLRIATRTENGRNSKIRKNNRSGLKGVCLHAVNKKWTAKISLNGKSKYLGSFPTKELASEAYQAAIKEHYGEFANPNA